MYDLIIIGMGISGITAGIYAKRAGLNVLILEKSAPGGTLNKLGKITNYPGYEEITGPDLAIKLFEQVRKLEIPFQIEEVIKIENSDIKKVITNKKEYECKNIIIATGRTPKYLGLDNEKDYLGRGLSTCATCDGYLYKGEDVAVVGGGNSALTESLYLANIVNKVYLIYKGTNFKGDKSLYDEILKKNNIEIITGTTIKNINSNDNKIESISLTNDRNINVKGVFIYIGYKPDTDIFKEFNITNIDGDILTDDDCKTELDGIFAVGDCRKKGLYQLVTASADGAVAVTNIK